MDISIEDDGPNDEDKKKKKGRPKKNPSPGNNMPQNGGIEDRPLTDEEIQSLEQSLLTLFEEISKADAKQRKEAKKVQAANEMQFLFRESQTDSYSDYKTDVYRNDYARLEMMLQEYLGSYLILGFKPNGEYIALRNCRTDIERHALVSLLNKYIVGGIEMDETES